MAQLSDKEKALIESAQREAAVPSDKAFSWSDWDDSVLGAESAFPETVIGWDNPAAEASGSGTAGDKWAYVAAMIEAERAEAQAQRAKRRRIALSVMGIVAVVAVLAGIQAFLSP